MQTLSGAQRKYLRGLAHGLKPVVQVGKSGITESLLASLEEALTSHELIKLKFVDHKEQRRELSAEIAERTDSEQVAMIGHVAVLYRPSREPEGRRIRLP